MTEAFADTTYWLAVLNPRDPYRQLALRIPVPARLVTTEAVLIEVVDALNKPELRPLA